MTNLKTNINKPFLIFASPRSGTAILMKIIKTYSKEQFNISEYFNVNDHTVIDDGLKLNFIDSVNNFENVDLEINNRIQLLEKYRHKNIPIKVLSNQITDTIFDYIKNKYSIILIERNTYDQLLSWLISTHTNVWNLSPNETFYPSEKFVAKLKVINRFFELQKIYQMWKNQFSGIIVHYEELDKSNNYKNIIEKIGLNYDGRDIIYPPQKLYSLTDKEKIIINLNEIRKYFE